MKSLESLCEQLKANGYRITPQRRAILQILLENHDHPTADQVLERAQRIMPDLSQATVYNILRDLVEMNILRKFTFGLGKRYYDMDTSDHAHLVCLKCGRVEDVPYDYEALAIAPEHLHGFQVVDHRVILRGYCPDCQEANSEWQMANGKWRGNHC